MNELVKFLKSEGFGGVVIIGGAIIVIGFSVHKILQIKNLKQQIAINEHELKKIEEEVGE